MLLGFFANHLMPRYDSNPRQSSCTRTFEGRSSNWATAPQHNTILNHPPARKSLSFDVKWRNLQWGYSRCQDGGLVEPAGDKPFIRWCDISHFLRSLPRDLDRIRWVTKFNSVSCWEGKKMLLIWLIEILELRKFSSSERRCWNRHRVKNYRSTALKVEPGIERVSDLLLQLLLTRGGLSPSPGKSFECWAWMSL